MMIPAMAPPEIPFFVVVELVSAAPLEADVVGALLVLVLVLVFDAAELAAATVVVGTLDALVVLETAAEGFTMLPVKHVLF